MNKKLIEAMVSQAEFSKRVDNDRYIEGYASNLIKVINDAGFVVVPKEPTEAMLVAAETYVETEGLWSYHGAYKAAIKAAQEESND